MARGRGKLDEGVGGREMTAAGADVKYVPPGRGTAVSGKHDEERCAGRGQTVRVKGRGGAWGEVMQVECMPMSCACHCTPRRTRWSELGREKGQTLHRVRLREKAGVGMRSNPDL